MAQAAKAVPDGVDRRRTKEPPARALVVDSIFDVDDLNELSATHGAVGVGRRNTVGAGAFEVQKVRRTHERAGGILQDLIRRCRRWSFGPRRGEAKRNNTRRRLGLRGRQARHNVAQGRRDVVLGFMNDRRPGSLVLGGGGKRRERRQAKPKPTDRLETACFFAHGTSFVDVR